MILYIGPGIGGGFLSAIIGLLISFLIAILALFWVPLKKLVRYLKEKFK